MAALTANRDVSHFVDQTLRTVPVAAAKRIFKGGLVGLAASGYAQPLVAGNPFIGLAYEEKDNSSGANGAMQCRVYTLGDFDVSLSGATVSDIGRPVFATTDQDLTFLADSNTFVGVVQDSPSTGKIILRIDPNRRLVKSIVHAVEDLAAGSDFAARAIHHFAVEGWIVNARVVNQATAAAGIDAGNTCVVTVAINAGNVATKTYNNAVTFPAANAKDSLGALTNVHAVAGDVMTLAVTNGATANPGPFLVEVDYV